MSEIIGFAGHAGAGKTAAALLTHDIVRPNEGRHIEFSDSIIAIANEWIEKSDATPDKSESLHVLSEVMAARCGADPKRFVASEYALPTMLSSAGENTGLITAENKSDFRNLLEWLGKTGLECVSSTVWADIVERKIQDKLHEGVDLITVSGIRSALDARAIRNTGGSVIKLRRGLSTKRHLTEDNLDSWKSDFEVSNDGSIDELHTSIKGVVYQILGKHLKSDGLVEPGGST